MNIEMTDLDMILNYLETTNLEPHDDYTSEITYKDQKILYKYIKELQQENQQLRIEISAREEEYRKLEDNRKKLKKIIKKKFVAQGGFTSYEWNDLLNELLDKMQELEDKSDVED